MEALIGVLLGGMLTVAGTFVISLILDRRARQHWQRESQLDAAREVLGALQHLVRKMIDLARVDVDDRADNWEQYHEATIRWNAARYAAALVCPESEINRLIALDVEIDRLIELATARQWRSREFQSERRALGRLAAEYLVDVRVNAGQSPIKLDSLWSWDDEYAASKEAPSTRSIG